MKYRMGELFKVGNRYVVNVYKSRLLQPIKLVKTFDAYSKPVLVARIKSFCKEKGIKQKDWNMEILRK